MASCSNRMGKQSQGINPGCVLRLYEHTQAGKRPRNLPTVTQGEPFDLVGKIEELFDHMEHTQYTADQKKTLDDLKSKIKPPTDRTATTQYTHNQKGASGNLNSKTKSPTDQTTTTQYIHNQKEELNDPNSQKESPHNQTARTQHTYNQTVQHNQPSNEEYQKKYVPIIDNRVSGNVDGAEFIAMKTIETSPVEVAQDQSKDKSNFLNATTSEDESGSVIAATLIAESNVGNGVTSEAQRDSVNPTTPEATPDDENDSINAASAEGENDSVNTDTTEGENYSVNDPTTEGELGSDSVKAILASFQSDNLDHSESSETNANVTINRKAIFATAQRAIKRRKFTFFKPVFVTFAGEDAVDEGGPKREFFRLLMRAVSESSIFHGSWFAHDLGLLAESRYELAGKLVAWSILQGGNGPRCLSTVGYDLRREVPVNLEAAIASVADQEMQGILNEATKCVTEEGFSVLVDKYGDRIAQYGYPKVYMCKLSDRDEMVDLLLKQYFVYGVHAEISQFFKGLNSIGNFGDMIMGNEALFHTILGNQQPRLTKAVFMSLYEWNRSDEGSNKREKEDETIYSFEVFLQDLEEGELGGLTLEDLLVFITAADCMPPLGFDKLITINFYDFAENNRRRPYASTCSLGLFLPRGFEDPSGFSSFMEEALLDYHGFGIL